MDRREKGRESIGRERTGESGRVGSCRWLKSTWTSKVTARMNALERVRARDQGRGQTGRVGWWERCDNEEMGELRNEQCICDSNCEMI